MIFEITRQDKHRNCQRRGKICSTSGKSRGSKVARHRVSKKQAFQADQGPGLGKD